MVVSSCPGLNSEQRLSLFSETFPPPPPAVHVPCSCLLPHPPASATACVWVSFFLMRRLWIFLTTRNCPLGPFLAGGGGDGTLDSHRSPDVCVALKHGAGCGCAGVCHPLAGPAQLHVAGTGSCWMPSSCLCAFAAGIQLFKLFSFCKFSLK